MAHCCEVSVPCFYALATWSPINTRIFRGPVCRPLQGPSKEGSHYTIGWMHRTRGMTFSFLCDKQLFLLTCDMRRQAGERGDLPRRSLGQVRQPHWSLSFIVRIAFQLVCSCPHAWAGRVRHLGEETYWNRTTVARNEYNPVKIYFYSTSVCIQRQSFQCKTLLVFLCCNGKYLLFNVRQARQGRQALYTQAINKLLLESCARRIWCVWFQTTHDRSFFVPSLKIKGQNRIPTQVFLCQRMSVTFMYHSLK